MLELGELQHQVELRQQAELRALQSQINPHFLFNALNTISGLCLTDPDRAREVILNLAGYFRQTLSLNESSVTLEQELSNVNHYLAITQARFENNIHVSWQLPDDRQSLRLPPLILQPLVENAVRHGGTSVDNRYVYIQITQNDRRAYIRVSDRGHGFPPEVLQKLQDPADPSYSGLFNVRKRLRSIYGSQCLFSVESSDHGSTVSFSIPLTMPKAA
jgi:two-component system sensor histidine kinase LytS